MHTILDDKGVGYAARPFLAPTDAAAEKEPCFDISDWLRFVRLRRKSSSKIAPGVLFLGLAVKAASFEEIRMSYDLHAAQAVRKARLMNV